MVSPNGETLTESPLREAAGERASLLNSVFGALRAEYFRDELYELFTHPTYFPQLLNRRPCILVGGRGTGKTTVLKSLSYEGQARLHPQSAISDWSFVGLYWRVDTSVVRAFDGPEVSQDLWTRLFSHYVNLTLVQKILDFRDWHIGAIDTGLQVDASSLERTASALGIEPTRSFQQLRTGVGDALLRLESAINNISADALPRTSILGRPVQYLIEALNADPSLRQKTYFFLIDEYENLSNYQQRVMNTLIKHAGDHQYTFKVGVREMGHRERSTINPEEQLIDPADYAYIDIADRLDDSSFADFSRQVCESRLARLRSAFNVLDTVDELFPSLGEEAEALKLGVEEANRTTRGILAGDGASEPELAEFDSLTPMSAYLVGYWAESQGTRPLETLREAISNSASWSTRLTNYQHAMLYTIRRRKRGTSKYYSGWATYAKLADGNIRYLLQLVYEALQLQLQDQQDLSTPLSAEIQTRAATAIGGRVVEQLQGLAANGGDLTRLVLGLGRIFGVMAAQPHGHTPEVSQFRVKGNPGPDVEELLRTAVMHLAVRRFATDKMASASGQIKDYSYQLHPIFAPFFVFSYRSKRRMDLDPKDIQDLVRNPTRAIPSILRRSRRGLETDLPPQLSLFRGYFNESD
jgi:hypothetical protein